MLLVGFEQSKFLIRPVADLLWESAVFLPEVRSGVMLHPALKRLDATVFFVVQGAMNGVVKMACCKIGLDASVDGLRAVLVKP
jgi:hypothetical protein